MGIDTKEETGRSSPAARRLIRDFQTSRKRAVAQLREELAKDAAERRASVAALRKDARQALESFQSQRRKAGSKMKEEMALSRSRRATGAVAPARGRTGDKSAVRDIKVQLLKVRRALRGDVKQTIDAPEEPVSILEDRKVPKLQQTAEETPETPDLKAGLLLAVKQSPRGITLAEAAGSLGVAPVVLGRAAKRLVEEGQIRKEYKTYFPPDTEQD